jgi:hypothetical protein
VSTELTTWERKHYVTGGGEPFLFYVVYGDIDWSTSLGRYTYRSDGVPDGLDVLSYGPDVYPEVPASFREDYPWDEFAALDPDSAAQVASCQHCVVIRGTPSDATTLNYLRDTIGLITFMLDHGGCAVYDPLMLRWRTAAEWKREIFDPVAPEPRRHVVILFSPEENPALTWFHTRGLLKFGRPDISVHNVPKEYEAGVIDLCNRLIEHQAFGHIVPDDAPVNMSSLPPGGVIKHLGSLDDPDFNNFHLEVGWPEAA